MATITITPGWAGPASAVGTNPIVVQVAGVGPPGAAGTSGVAPSGTGIVTVTSGSLNTPAALTGDVTTTAGGLATTLATVNSNVGSFTNATVTVNAKGLVTAASSGAAGGITIGDTVTSGTAYRVLYVGATGLLAQDGGIVWYPGSGLELNGYILSTNFAQMADKGRLNSSGLRLASDVDFGFTSSSGSSGTVDTASKRAAAKVIGLTDGSTAGATLSSVPLTPAQITSNQNNYAPGVARYYRLSTDASRDITGLSCSQVSGQECEIWNVDANNIVLKHQDANSTAANRFICTGAADITLAADEVALLRYDSVTSRWRVRKI